jgi:hypothetical protein
LSTREVLATDFWHRKCILVVEFMPNTALYRATSKQTRNLRKCLMNFTKSETTICPDVLMNPVFQVLSDDGRAPGSLLIVNICPVLV